MRIFVILILSVFVHNQLHAGNITPEVRQAYKERTEFVKKYISTIKENRKTNKKFKGSIVEAVSGRLYTSWGTLSQYELDQKALKNCKSDGEIECLVRFRTLKKNPKYNRYAKYINSKSSLKVLGEHIKSKKKFSSKGIDILISTENFKNKNDFFCGQTKSNYKDVINNLVKEINVYPVSFLQNSGLKYVMICEKITDKSLGFEPGGLAPGHVDQSPGVFYLNLSAVNKIKNSKTKKDYIRILFHHL